MDDSFIVDIADDLVVSVLSDWIDSKVLAKLDTSFCNSKNRDWFLNLLASRVQTESIRNSPSYFNWIKLRKLKLRALWLRTKHFENYSDALENIDLSGIISINYNQPKEIDNWLENFESSERQDDVPEDAEERAFAAHDWFMNFMESCPNFKQLHLTSYGGFQNDWEHLLIFPIAILNQLEELTLCKTIVPDEVYVELLTDCNNLKCIRLIEQKVRDANLIYDFIKRNRNLVTLIIQECEELVYSDVLSLLCSHYFPFLKHIKLCGMSETPTDVPNLIEKCCDLYIAQVQFFEVWTLFEFEIRQGGVRSLRINCFLDTIDNTQEYISLLNRIPDVHRFECKLYDKKTSVRVCDVMIAVCDVYAHSLTTNCDLYTGMDIPFHKCPHINTLDFNWCLVDLELIAYMQTHLNIAVLRLSFFNGVKQSTLETLIIDPLNGLKELHIVRDEHESDDCMCAVKYEDMPAFRLLCEKNDVKLIVSYGVDRF